MEQEEWDKAMEWAFCNMISTDAMVIDEIRKVTKDTDPIGENGRIWVPDKEHLRRRIVELYCDESHFYLYFSSFFPYILVPISMFNLSSHDLSLTPSLPLLQIVTMSLTSLLLCYHL